MLLELKIRDRQLSLKKTVRRVSRAVLFAPAHTLHSLIHVFICAVILFSLSWLRAADPSPSLDEERPAAVSEEETDEALQRTAMRALGGREGTIVLMDPQTGRLRAVVNSRLAFEEAFPPGSAIKPFTMLAALRTGVIKDDSSMLCRERYRRGAFEIRCSHPKQKPPFNPVQALAYSCNYYFSKLGEQLDERLFNPTLDSFGFGTRTGAREEREAAGQLPHGAWRISSALGDNPQLRVTPVQLITAYAALFNGGHLYLPRRAAPQGFQPEERARLEIAPAHRTLLLKGLRGAIAYGTAARAGLGALPEYLFGKTGTSTPSDDFRTTHGWFVGFAAEQGAGGNAPPAAIRLAVLVFLRRAQGAESAELARPIFEEYARLQHRDVETERRADRENNSSSLSDRTSASASRSLQASQVRVRLLRHDVTQTMSLDDYLFGVLAAEGSVEDELEALKALAVVSRTFALKNMGRHARDRFDFCNSTHCQRYVNVLSESARADFYNLLHRALQETAGEVLLDGQGRIADAYFSADCGGRTASLNSLWGAPAPVYLRGVPDQYCASAPERNWTNTIPVRDLIRALHGDPRSDVGARLQSVRVIKRDASGRAEMIALQGERSRTLRGWDFKIIVGRTLGWNILKSTRFEVARAGLNFVFRGRGFGHGLGLCQTGAHVMARRGASYQQIIKQYFPGVNIGGNRASARLEDDQRQAVPDAAPPRCEEELTRRVDLPEQRQMWSADVLLQLRTASRSSLGQSSAYPADGAQRVFVSSRLPVSSSQRRLISSEHFRASYPAHLARRDVEAVLGAMEAVRADVQQRLAAASINLGGLPPLELFIHDTTGDFVGATAQPPWVAAATRGHRIELQPLAVLRRRGVLLTTLRHEYTHAIIAVLGRGRAPRWLAEGLAAYVAGEGAVLSRYALKKRPSLDEIEKRLEQPASAEEMRALYAAAYLEVRALIQREGEAGAWRRVARS
jgi:stage II sporulation protein D